MIKLSSNADRLIPLKLKKHAWHVKQLIHLLHGFVRLLQNWTQKDERLLTGFLQSYSLKLLFKIKNWNNERTLRPMSVLISFRIISFTVSARFIYINNMHQSRSSIPNAINQQWQKITKLFLFIMTSQSCLTHTQSSITRNWENGTWKWQTVLHPKTFWLNTGGV